MAGGPLPDDEADTIPLHQVRCEDLILPKFCMYFNCDFWSERPHLLELVNVRATKDFAETLVGEVSLPVTLSTSWRLDPPEVGEEPVRKGMYKTGSRHDQPGDAMYWPFMYIKIFKTH